MEPKRLALIGVRHMGCEHYMNLLDLVEQGKVQLQALCDTHAAALDLPKVEHSPLQLEALLTVPRTRADQLPLLHQKMQHLCDPLPNRYDDYRQMLDNEKLDGVIVCTPNHLHREMAEYALARNVNVLCEKPLASNVVDCEAMLDAERRSAAFLQVGLHMRYRRLNHHIKRAIDEGRLGQICMAWCQEFRADWNLHATRVPALDGTPTNWRYLQQASGGSVVEKLCHDLDLFNWWLDARPVRVSGSGGNSVCRDRETVDHANMLIDYDNDVSLNISLCMFSPNNRFRGRYMGLIGEKASLDLDSQDASYTIYENVRNGPRTEYKQVEPPTTPGHHAGNASQLQLQAFAASIAGGEKPLATAEAGRDSVLVAQAVEVAIRERRVVELAELLTNAADAVQA